MVEKTFEESVFDNESPTVDKDSNLTDNGELKELVEEVKEKQPKAKKVPKSAQITPDNEFEYPEELTPKEDDKDKPKSADELRAERTIGTS